MLGDRLGQRCRAGGVLSVRLHAANQGRQGPPGGQLGRLLVDTELAGQLVHGDLGEEIVEIGHGVIAPVLVTEWVGSQGPQ